MTKENKWFFIIAVVFAIGIVMGCMYCVFIKNNEEMYEYLHDFIVTIKDGADKKLIFRKSFIRGMKIIGLFFACAMMKYGCIPVCGITLMKGFSVGFTFAALFKYFDKNGIWVMLSQISSNVLIFIVIVFFGAVCAMYGLNGKGRFIKIILLFLISCIGIAAVAYVSGYVDVYILTLVAKRWY